MTIGARESGARSSLRRLRDFVVARFDPRSHLGLSLTWRLVTFALAVWVFSGLVDAVLDNETLVRIDLAVETWFHLHSTVGGVRIFTAITQLGSPVVDVLIVVIGLMLLYRREYPMLVAWLGANLGGKAIEYVLKNTIHRTRPQYGTNVLHGVSYSFPSGHTMGSTVCYLMLAYIIAAHPGVTKRARWLAFIMAAMIIAAVAFSRLYLVVHYPSDVLGGFSAGMAWLAVCGTTRHLVTGGRALQGSNVPVAQLP